MTARVSDARRASRNNVLKDVQIVKENSQVVIFFDLSSRVLCRHGSRVMMRIVELNAFNHCSKEEILEC